MKQIIKNLLTFLITISICSPGDCDTKPNYKMQNVGGFNLVAAKIDETNYVLSSLNIKSMKWWGFYSDTTKRFEFYSNGKKYGQVWIMLSDKLGESTNIKGTKMFSKSIAFLVDADCSEWKLRGLKSSWFSEYFLDGKELHELSTPDSPWEYPTPGTFANQLLFFSCETIKSRTK